MSSQLLPRARIKTRPALALSDRLKAIGSQLELLIEASSDVADATTIADLTIETAGLIF